MHPVELNDSLNSMTLLQCPEVPEVTPGGGGFHLSENNDESHPQWRILRPGPVTELDKTLALFARGPIINAAASSSGPFPDQQIFLKASPDVLDIMLAKAQKGTMMMHGDLPPWRSKYILNADVSWDLPATHSPEPSESDMIVDEPEEPPMATLMDIDTPEEPRGIAEQNIPSPIPLELQALVDAYLFGRPLTIISSRHRVYDHWSLLLPTDCGYAMMGYFRVLGVQVSNICDHTFFVTHFSCRRTSSHHLTPWTPKDQPLLWLAKYDGDSISSGLLVGKNRCGRTCKKN